MERTFKDDIADSISPVSEGAAHERGLFVLRTTVRGTPQSPVIEIILDGERQVALEDCETVSRAVNTAIEERQLVKGNYRLDVLSPGVEEPLKLDYQFRRNVGRTVLLEVDEGDEKKSVRGTLTSFDEDEIVLTPKPRKGQKVKPPQDDSTSLIHVKRSSVKRATVEVELFG